MRPTQFPVVGLPVQFTAVYSPESGPARILVYPAVITEIDPTAGLSPGEDSCTLTIFTGLDHDPVHTRRAARTTHPAGSPDAAGCWSYIPSAPPSPLPL